MKVVFSMRFLLLAGIIFSLSCTSYIYNGKDSYNHDLNFSVENHQNAEMVILHLKKGTADDPIVVRKSDESFLFHYSIENRSEFYILIQQKMGLGIARKRVTTEYREIIVDGEELAIHSEFRPFEVPYLYWDDTKAEVFMGIYPGQLLHRNEKIVLVKENPKYDPMKSKYELLFLFECAIPRGNDLERFRLSIPITLHVVYE